MNTKSIPALVSAALLAGCATTTTTTTTAIAPVATAPDAASLTRVYFYAQNGQSEARQDRDRFECFNWAVEKTGFDPSRRALPPERREQVVPVAHPGATVLAGTVTGALIGAAVSNPWDRGEGAAIGAIAGTALGSIAASSEAKAIRTAHAQMPARSGYEQQAAGFRRAMSACLEGRGYVVK
jgi:hypothetical protein